MTEVAAGILSAPEVGDAVTGEDGGGARSSRLLAVLPGASPAGGVIRPELRCPIAGEAYPNAPRRSAIASVPLLVSTSELFSLAIARRSLPPRSPRSATGRTFHRTLNLFLASFA